MNYYLIILFKFQLNLKQFPVSELCELSSVNSVGSQKSTFVTKGFSERLCGDMSLASPMKFSI